MDELNKLFQDKKFDLLTLDMIDMMMELKYRFIINDGIMVRVVYEKN